MGAILHVQELFEISKLIVICVTMLMVFNVGSCEIRSSTSGNS